MTTNHSWSFFRAGGFDQVRLATGADLMALDQLDQKLWVALACPTTGIEFDPRTLALLDTDKDGRIRAPEVVAAVKWTGSCLKSPDDLLRGSPELPLSAINDSSPEGRQLLASAKQILANIGKKDATVISVEEATDTVKIFAQTNFNGDGIVPADAAEDEATKAVIKDIIECLGAVPDRSGKPGINQEKADKFFAESAAFSDWWKSAEADPAVLPLNGSTATAAATFKLVKAKVDDYFTRCRLAAFDPRAVNALNREEKEYAAVAVKDLSLASTEIAGFPLAQVAPGKPLPLKEGVNPAWAEAMAKFEVEVVRPFLNGKGHITEADWAAITAKFAGFEKWNAGKPATSVEKLGLKRIREVLAGKAKANLQTLIAKDKELEPEASAIAAVEKLTRYNRDLFKFVNNFVSFRDFYSRQGKAIFQAGTLFLDQRSCELCLWVDDAAKHAAMGALAGTYLAYCDLVRKGTGQKKQIVAAFTGGDSDNLMAGRNGIFYDRQGNDWDATITKIVDNPISVRQAFWAPYKKLVRLIEEQVAKRASAADTAANEKLLTTATNVAHADKTVTQAMAAGAAAPAAAPATAPAPAPPARKIDVGVVAAMGVAVGAIGGALATLSTGLAKLTSWQIPLVILGAILMISVPSVIIAWLKLRKRNIGPLLDANGWAVNARARINIPFGGSLTQVASLPAGAATTADPFADKKSVWPTLIGFVLLVWLAYAILNHMGYVYEWTKGRLGSERPVKVDLKVTPGSPDSEPKVEVR